jgi:hypothetical protein
MSRVQDATFRCDCGKDAPVTPGATPWEFDVTCACGWAYRLSWAHRDPPPHFAPPARLPERAEPRLWDA